MNEQASLPMDIPTPQGPRVTMADIEAQIAGEHYFTAAEGVMGAFAAAGITPTLRDTPFVSSDVPEPLSLLTFCVLVLRNGFTVTGESACASPENFNEQKGREVARQHAVEKVWPLMGFALRNEITRQRPMAISIPDAPV